MTLLLALTEGERVAIIAGLLAIGAGVPGAIAAIISARTRKENTTQHGESLNRLGELTEVVTIQTVKLDEVREHVRDIAAKVDDHSVQITQHGEHLRHLPVHRATGSTGPHAV